MYNVQVRVPFQNLLTLYTCLFTCWYVNNTVELLGNVGYGRAEVGLVM